MPTIFMGSWCSRTSRFTATFASARRRRLAFVTVEVGLRRQPGEQRQAADVVHPLRGPDALGDLGTGVGRDEDLVADARGQLARVEVVQAPVPLEGDGAHHRHGGDRTARGNRPVTAAAP
jgi:hypothetical protein